MVKLTDGRVMPRHQDHIRLRYDKENTMFADRTAAGGSIQVETPQETISEEQGHSVVPAKGYGISRSYALRRSSTGTRLTCVLWHMRSTAQISLVTSLLKD